MDGLGPIDIEILINNPELLRTLMQGERDFQSVNNRMIQQAKSTSNELDGWAKKAAIAVTSYFSVQAAKNFVSELINVRGEFEQLNVAYDTILKSKQKGDLLFAESVKFAATTPFNLTEVATATKQLLAYGFAAKDITSVLTTVGNVAAGVSAPIGDIVYLYGTLKTQGRAYAQDIRQFTGRGIPIIQELAKQFGVTDDQVNKLVESGKVGFPQVQKAFESLTGSSGIFYNLMEKQSQTLTGQLSNLQDAFSQLLNKLGSDSQSVLSGGIAEAADIINNYQRLIDIIGLLIASYGAYQAAVFTTTVIQRVNQEATLQQALAGRELTAVEALQAVGARTLSAAQFSLTAALKSGTLATLAYTAAFAAIGLIIYAFANATSAAEAAQKSLNDITTDASKSILDQKGKIESLERTVTNLNKTEDTRLSAAKKLREIMGDRLKQYTDEELKAGKAKKAIDEYTNSLQRNAQVAAAASKIQDLEGQIIDLDTKGITAIPIADRIADGLGGVFTGNATTNTADEIAHFKTKIQGQIKSIQKIYQDEIDKANADTGSAGSKGSKFTIDLNLAINAKGVQPILSSFNNLLKEAGNKADLDALQKALQDKIDALAPNDAKRAELRKRLADVDAILKTYSSKSDAAGAKAYDIEFQKRQSIFDKIGDLQAQTLANAKTADQREVDQVKAKYDNILRAIDEYNRKAKIKIDPKNVKLANGTVINVPQAEKAAVDDVTAKQSIEQDKQTIAAQKQLFDEFEQYKEQYGQDAAMLRYSNELKGFKSYVEYLKSLLPNASDNSAKANATRDLINKDLLPKAQLDESKAAVELNLKNLKRIDDATESSAAKRSEVDRKYFEDIATLNNNRSKYTDQDFNDRLTKLAENHELELIGVKQMSVTETAYYKDAFANITNLSIDQLKKRIDQAKETLSQSDLPASVRRAAIAKLQNAKAELGDQGYSVDQFGQVIDDYDQVAEKSKQIAAYADAVQSSFHELGSALADVNPGLADTLNTIGDIASVGSSAAKSVAGFSNGDIVGGVTNAISAIAGVFSIGSKATASRLAAQKELKAYQDALIAGEITYNELLRDRARSQSDITNMTIQELDAREKLLETQKLQAQADYNRLLAQITGSGQQVTGEHTEKYGGILGIGKKTKVVQDLAGLGGADYDQLEKLYTEGKLTDATKAWFEQLQKVHDEMGDIDDATQAVNDQLDQIFTGTTADSLGKSILDGLKAGKRGFSDFADDFSTAMQGSLDSVFENGYLKDKEAEFYKQFAALSESGGGLDASEIAKLKDLYGQLVNGASSAYDDLQEILGTAGITPNQSALQAGITGITADQAGVLEGTTKGIQLAVLQLVQFSQNDTKSMGDQIAEMRAQTIIQKQIAVSAARTADNTTSMDKTLASIEQKMSDPANALAANGRSIWAH